MDTPTAEGIDPGNLARLQLQERLAAAGGFSLDAPLYALGKGVNAVGVANAGKSRAEWAALPPARDALAPFLARVAGEQRRDYTVPVRELRLTPGGTLARLNGDRELMLAGPMPLKGLLARTECPEPGAAATYLATIPAARRAAEFNAWTEGAEPDRTAVLRSRLALAPVESEGGALAPYGREVFAVVTEKYGTGVEVDTLGRAMLDAIARDLFPGDARATVVYDGRRAEVQVLWHSDVAPEAYCAGEVFKAGVSIGAADDGSLSIGVDSLLWRNLCLNLIILQEARQRAASRRHVGTAAEMADWLVGALREASRKVAGFAELWGGAHAAQLNAPSVVRDVPDGTAPREVVSGVFRGLLRGDRLSLPGFRGENAVKVLDLAFDREPEYSKVGIVSAVTRAAHENVFAGAWCAADIEESAGRILASKRPFDFVDLGATF